MFRTKIGFSFQIAFSLIVPISLILTGCSGINQNSEVPTQEVNAVIATELALTASASGIDLSEISSPFPVEEITGIPTHAPTITVDPANTPLPENDQAPNEGEIINLAELGLGPVNGEDSLFPEAEILIYRPGELSRVISPFRVTTILGPDPNGNTWIELLGEDGRILDSQLVHVVVYPGHETGTATTMINFEIEGVAEAGRLQVSIRDEFGRLQSLNSVNLVLLSNGLGEENAQAAGVEQIIVQQPFENYMISGDTLLVSGIINSTQETILEIDIIDEFGQSIANGGAIVLVPEDSEYGLFIASIPYQVSEPIWVRVIIRIQGQNIPGNAYISSLEVVLSP